MFLKLLSIENTKIFRRSVIWVELFLFIGLTALAYLLIGLTSPDANSISLLAVLDVKTSSVLQVTTGNSVGGLLFVVLVAASTASEYGWGTINLLLSRGAPRPLVMLAKVLAQVIPALLIVIFPLFGASVVSAFLTLAQKGSLSSISQVDWKSLAEGILLSAYTLFPYGLLAFLLATLTRSTIFSIAFAGGFSLIGENLLVGLLLALGGQFGRIIYYLPMGLARGLLGAVHPVDSAGFLSPGLSAVGILLYSLVFLGLSIWIFQRQDMSSGS